MKQYDFDKIVDRHGTNSLKYDALKERYGRDDLICGSPIWTSRPPTLSSTP